MDLRSMIAQAAAAKRGDIVGTTCGDCGARIFHAIEPTTGKRVPVDMSPHSAGTLRIDMSGMVPSGEVLSGDTRQAALDRGEQLYISHYYTCGGTAPDAA